MKRLIIPDWEKEKGIVWVEYVVSYWCDGKLYRAVAELVIQQGVN